MKCDVCSHRIDCLVRETLECELNEFNQYDVADCYIGLRCRLPYPDSNTLAVYTGQQSVTIFVKEDTLKLLSQLIGIPIVGDKAHGLGLYLKKYTVDFLCVD